MNKFKIGIIGNGFVGGAISRGLNHYHEVKIYDVYEHKRTHDLQETIQQEIVFICLPTPMFKNTFECDLSYIKNFFDEVVKIQKTSDAIFVIKSTVPIGTTEQLCNEYKSLKIIHSPEFLTARTSTIDFITPSRNIIGGKVENGTEVLKKLYVERFPGVQCLVMSSNESEFIKYFANTFFATKVSFFNEMYLLCSKMNLNWENVLNGVMSDGRIGISHYQVPGHDGDFGFGGTCFPKDINAFIKTFEKYDIDPIMLKSAWNRNVSVRKHKDWENFKSAVS